MEQVLGCYPYLLQFSDKFVGNFNLIGEWNLESYICWRLFVGIKRDKDKRRCQKNRNGPNGDWWHIHWLVFTEKAFPFFYLLLPHILLSRSFAFTQRLFEEHKDIEVGRCGCAIRDGTTVWEFSLHTRQKWYFFDRGGESMMRHFSFLALCVVLASHFLHTITFFPTLLCRPFSYSHYHTVIKERYGLNQRYQSTWCSIFAMNLIVNCITCLQEKAMVLSMKKASWTIDIIT